ncbi:NAD-dependent epimerase/dehydratase family protein [Saccharothrix saharensis]|uniref:NAD-dependent epimerase/dehydratase family protein n=1 Tax=Saccharothrix saharensis TaxID=571190 RepID=UPI001FE5B11D|nr:NAD-dependent epimerase/dehydratase [Saccharothrix saharensis]
MTRTLAGTFVAVLGGSGFVGSAVSARLAAKGARVRVVARNPGVPSFPSEVVAADLTEPGAVAAAVAGADVVLPLVLFTGGGSWRVADGGADDAARVNVGIVAEAVAEARGTVVFAGSTSQVGPGAPERIDGTETDRPDSEYDQQKCAAERLVRDAGGCSLRLPTVFGPSTGSPDRGVVTAMARRALAGEPLTVWSAGDMERDLVFVEDVAEAFAAAVAHADRLAGRAWLVGSGAGVAVRALFELIAATVADHTGRPAVPVRSVSPPPHATASDFRSLVADPAALTLATGWRPRVPLADAVSRTVAHLARSSVDSPRSGTPIPG